MTKTTAPKAPAKSRAKAETPAVETIDDNAAPAPKLVLSLHDRIDWNDPA